jgi:hypothetical protein
MSTVGPDLAMKILAHLRARKPGRHGKKKSDVAYRALARRWERWRPYHRELSDDQAARKFRRDFRRDIERLEVKIGSPDVLRKARARGLSARRRTKERREKTWRVMPALSLADTLAGRHHRLVTDMTAYVLQKAGFDLAYGAQRPLDI